MSSQGLNPSLPSSPQYLCKIYRFPGNQTLLLPAISIHPTTPYCPYPIHKSAFLEKVVGGQAPV